MLAHLLERTVIGRARSSGSSNAPSGRPRLRATLLAAWFVVACGGGGGGADGGGTPSTLSLLASTPAEGTRDVPRDVVPRLTFSVPLDPATLTGPDAASRFWAYDGAGTPTIDHAAGAQGAVLSLRPSHKLLPGVQHLAGANRDLRGSGGQPLPKEPSIVGPVFTTADIAWASTASFGRTGNNLGSERTAASNRFGTTVVAWVQPGTSPASWRLMSRVYHAGTSRWDDEATELAAVDDGDALTQPVAAVADNGDIVVAWHRSAFSHLDVRHRAAATGTWGAPIRLAESTGALSLSATAQPGGRVHLLWRVAGDVHEMLSATGRIDDPTAWQAPKRVVTADAGWQIQNSQAVALPAGGAMVVWEEVAVATGFWGVVRARRLDDAGLPLGTEPTLVGALGANGPAVPSVAVQEGVTPAQNFVSLAWRWQGNTEDRILLRRWNSINDTWEGTATQPLTLAVVPHTDRRLGRPTALAAPGRWGWIRPGWVVWGETRGADGVFRLRGVSLTSPSSAPAAAIDLVGDTAATGATTRTAEAPQGFVDRAGNLLLVYEHPMPTAGGGMATELRSLRRLGRTGDWSAQPVGSALRDSAKVPVLVGASETGSGLAVWIDLDQNNNRQLRGRAFD